MHVPHNRPTIDQIINSQWIQDTPIMGTNLRTAPAATTATKTNTKKQPCFLGNSKKHKAETNKNTSIDMNLVQLHFNTKRTNSVLEPNFLHPIDNIEQLAEKDAIISNTQNKSFLSTKFKKRIGPMEPKAKEKSFIRQDDDGRSNNNNKKTQITNDINGSSAKIDKCRPDANATYDGTSFNGSQKSSLNVSINPQYMDEQQDDFLRAPTPTDNLTHLNPLEMETRMILLKLGISSEMLCKAMDNGPRSDVIGAYRIVIHRLQKQQFYAQHAEALTAFDEQPSLPKNNHRICAIL